MKEPTNYIICERTDKQWQDAKQKRLRCLSDKLVEGGIDVGDLIAIIKADKSADQYAGKDYDAKFPKAIFAGFQLAYFASKDRDVFHVDMYQHCGTFENIRVVQTN